MDPSVIVLGLLFEPDIGEFSSCNFTVRTLDNKEITFYAKDGVIQFGNNKEKLPKFQQEFHYPSYGIPRNIRDISENLRTVAESFGETKFSKFEIDWGFNEDTNPYLIRFTRLDLAQGKQLKPLYNEAMIFASLQKSTLYETYSEEEEIDESRCYLNTKRCTRPIKDFDKKKIIEYHLSYYTKSIQSLSQKKETTQNILNVMQQFCPEMLEGTVKICQNCFKKMMTYQQQKHAQSKLNTNMKAKSSLQPNKRLYSSAPVPIASNTQKITGRSSFGSKYNDSNNDILLTQRDYRSGAGYLRPTQKISYISYKRASKIYLSTSGFPSLLQNRPRK